MPSNTASLTNAEPWLPEAFNGGHAYRDRLDASAASAIGFYAERYPHSSAAIWQERLAAGEIWRNGCQLRSDGPLHAGDRLIWQRPPWREPAVPQLLERAVVLDDGDLLVLNKPSGLPVLPAGGFLNHTLLQQLHAWPQASQARPVHRLGRFTSGLLVCARTPQTRAWLSAQLRESTRGGNQPVSACKKVYRALTAPLPSDWQLGEQRLIRVPIGRRPHARLGMVWCAASAGESSAADLAAYSRMVLLQRRSSGALVEVTIASGRPHQIRIHAAAVGAPLLGDPLYQPGGAASNTALPGEGGYLLHAHRLTLHPPDAAPIVLEAPLPDVLREEVPGHGTSAVGSGA